ncbi:MAG: hypothetical protein ACYCZY_08790 [Lacisediminihabitans sp.]
MPLARADDRGGTAGQHEAGVGRPGRVEAQTVDVVVAQPQRAFWMM